MKSYNSKEELKKDINIVPHDKMISSQLVIRQEAKASELFEEKDIIVKIVLELKYNDWNVNVNFLDTLHRNEIAKNLLLHP